MIAINNPEHKRESLKPTPRFFLAIENPEIAPDAIKAASEPIAMVSIGFLSDETTSETTKDVTKSETNENKVPRSIGESRFPCLLIILLFFIKNLRISLLKPIRRVFVLLLIFFSCVCYGSFSYGSSFFGLL